MENQTDIDATREDEGVSQEDQQKTIDQMPSFADQRQAVLDAIAEKYEADVAEQFEDLPEEGSGEGAAEKSSDKPPEAETKKPDQEAKPEDDQKVKLVIDGREQEVPLSRVMDAGTRALQKDLAADKRLEEATKLLNEAKSLQKERPSEEDAGSRTSEQTSDAGDIDMKDIIQAIRYGSDEEAEAAGLKLAGNIKGKGGPGLSVEQIVGQVRAHTAAEEIKSFFTKSPDEGGFSDIYNDPDLRTLAEHKVNELVEGGNGTFLTLSTYREAFDYVRGKFSKPASGEGKTDLEKKQERKRGTDNVRTGATRSSLPSTENEDKAQNPSDVIAEMRKQRVGQG